MVAACLRIVRDRAVSSSPAAVLSHHQQPGAQPLGTAAAANARHQLNKPGTAQSPVSSQDVSGHGRCNGPTGGQHNIRVRLVTYFPLITLAC